MPTVDPTLLDEITALFHYLRVGKPIKLLDIPEDLPDNELRQLMTFINRFLVEYLALTKDLAKIAQGDLEFQPLASRMALAQSLKTLQSNLRHLTWKTQQVAAGDLTQQVDFMGDFSLAFNSMTQQLKESRQQLLAMNQQLEQRNRFIRETFGRYTSEEIVQVLLDMPEGLKLGGEKRQITILMSDLRGFTALVERLEPTVVVAMLNNYLAAMIDVIQAEGGTIDEIIGDAILVLFGAPVAWPDAPLRAVRTALAMQQAMVAVNRHHREQGWPEIAMGLALHTGEVVVGNLGSRKRTKYGVVGRAINLTARIESYTVGGQILVSPALMAAAGDGLVLGEEILVSAKGMREPLACRELLGHTEYPELHLASRAEVLTPLVPPLPCSFYRLDGKHLSGQAESGHLTALGSHQACLNAANLPVQHDNILLTLTLPNVPQADCAVYAKVLHAAKPPLVGRVVHFTSISPAVTRFLVHLQSLKPQQQAD